MNRTADKSISNLNSKRGALARKLLQSAKRQGKSKALPKENFAEDLPTNSAKVLGPYQNASKWRLVIKEGQGRKSLVFETEAEALAVRRDLLANFDNRTNRTIGDTVDEYLEQKRKRGYSERSARSVREKLAFLPADKRLNSITPQSAEALYIAQTEMVAVATHHANLRSAKAFYRYCCKKQYVSLNPFAELQTIGKANAGKLQLRQDEARKLTNYLINKSQSGDRFAMALLVQVLLGLRSAEVLGLRKRDLDCGASVVAVDGTKNKNAKRRLELNCPAVRDLLLQRCAPLAPESLIFAQDATTERAPVTPSLQKALARCCKAAGVPIVCPHSLRGLHSSLAVKAGATSAFVAQALGHGSDAVTRKHYIAPDALESARSARVAGALLGAADLDGLIETLRRLPSEQLNYVFSSVGLSSAPA